MGEEVYLFKAFQIEEQTGDKVKEQISMTVNLGLNLPGAKWSERWGDTCPPWTFTAPIFKKVRKSSDPATASPRI
jgi:hypothetical protein